MMVIGAIKPGSLDAAKIERLLAQTDHDGHAQGLSVRSYANTLTLGAGRQSGPPIDVATGEIARDPSTIANWLQTSRRVHETLLIEARWLVTASTVAMLVLICL